MSYTLKELAELTQTKLIGDPEHVIIGVDELDSATETDASFLENPRYEKQLKSSAAGDLRLLYLSSG